MSKVVKPASIRQLSHIVETDDGKWYLVDCQDLRGNILGGGLELMVFKVRKRSGTVSDWKHPVLEEHLGTYEELYVRHHQITQHLEQYI